MLLGAATYGLLVGVELAEVKLSAGLDVEILWEEKLATSVEVPFSEDAKAVIQRAAIEADDLGSREIHTAHLLLGILVRTQGAALRVLHDAGVTAAELRSLLARRSV